MLKSILCRAMDFDGEAGKAFQKALAALCKLPDGCESTLARETPNLEALRANKKRQDFIDAQVARLGISRNEAGTAHKVISLFLDHFVDDRCKGDSPEAIFSDLDEMGFVPEGGSERILSLIQLIQAEVAPKIRFNRLVRDLSIGVLPAIIRVESTVELRAVLDPQFIHGDDPATHAVNVVAVVPTATIVFVTKGNADQPFVVQCDQELLDLVIEKLEVTRKEMQTMQDLADRFSK